MSSCVGLRQTREWHKNPSLVRWSVSEQASARAMWMASSVAGTKASLPFPALFVLRVVIVPILLLFILKVTCVLCWNKFLFRFVFNCNRINSFFFSSFAVVVLRSPRSCFARARVRAQDMRVFLFSFSTRNAMRLCAGFSHAHAVRLCRTSDQSSSCLITINNKLHAFSVHFFVIHVSLARTMRTAMLTGYTVNAMVCKKRVNFICFLFEGRLLFCALAPLCNRNAMSMLA